MDKQELERNLSVRRCYGFSYDTGDPNFLGALRIFYVSPTPFPPYDPIKEPEQFASWPQRRQEMLKEPYRVAIREIRKEITEADLDPDEKDFKIDEEHWFASLDDLERFTYDRFRKRIADFQFGGDFIPYW